MRTRFFGYAHCKKCGYTFYRESATQTQCPLCTHSRYKPTPPTTVDKRAKRREPTLDPIPCHQCGEMFRPHDRRGKYCSRECAMVAQVAIAAKKRGSSLVTRTCVFCESEYETYQPAQRYCSSRCRYAARDQRITAARRAEKALSSKTS